MKTTLLCTTLAAILLASGCNSADNSGAQTPTHITQHDDSSGSGTGAGDTGSGSGAGGAGSGSSTGGTGSGSGTGGTGGDSGAGGAGSGSGDGGTGSGSGTGGTGSGSGAGGTGSGSGAGGTGSGSGDGGTGSGSGTGGTGSGSGDGGTGSGSGTGGTDSGSGDGGTGSGSGTGGTGSGSGDGGTGSGTGGTGSGSGAGGAGGGSGASADETATDTYCLVTYHLQNQHALSPCSHDGKFGYKAADNTLKITPQFDLAYEFNQDNLARVTEKGKWFYINQNGDKITGAYDWLYEFKDGLARFFKDNKYGYLNQSGQEVIAATYQQAENFNSGLAAVALNNQYGLIDKTGNFVLANTYDQLNYLAPKRFRAQKKSANTDEVIDETGAKVRDYVIYTSEGAVQSGDYDMGTQVRIVRKHIGNGDNYQLLLSQSRKELTPPYYQLADFKNGLAWIAEGYSSFTHGIINTKGQKITKSNYHILSQRNISFPDGFEVAIRGNGKYTFIDKSGNELTSKDYQQAAQFSDGLAAVKLNDKWGFIDTTGAEVVAFNYQSVKDFIDGFALVQSAQNHKWGVIDRTGKSITVTKYDTMENLGKGLFAGKEGQIWHFLNSAKEASTSQFTLITNFGDGIGAGYGSSTGKWALLDVSGELTPSKYEKIIKVDSHLFAAQTSTSNIELINHHGTKLGTQNYSAIYSFKNGFAIAAPTTMHRYGFIDKSGNTLIDLKHSSITPFNDLGFSRASTVYNQYYNHYGYYHRSGKVVIPLQYRELTDIGYLGLAKDKPNNFVITLTGRKITEPAQINNVYLDTQTAKPIGNGLVKVATKASKYGFINANGDTVIDIEYEGFDDDAFTDAQPFADAFKNGKKIQINGAGQCIANCL